MVAPSYGRIFRVYYSKVRRRLQFLLATLTAPPEPAGADGALPGGTDR